MPSISSYLGKKRWCLERLITYSLSIKNIYQETSILRTQLLALLERLIKKKRLTHVHINNDRVLLIRLASHSYNHILLTIPVPWLLFYSYRIYVDL